jgi:hypothetical protein
MSVVQLTLPCLVWICLSFPNLAFGLPCLDLPPLLCAAVLYLMFVLMHIKNKH